MNLSKEEVFEAIKEGVKEAFHEMMESGNGITGSIRTEEVMQAIKDGTQNAIFNIATNGTDAPCADFYDSVKDGVRQAVEHMEMAKWVAED